MPTIKEVSRHAQVSPATVSRVLNGTVPVANDTKKRVLDAVKKLNYQPNAFARGLVTNRSGGIGVVINEISSPYYSGIVRGIENVVEEAGMHLVVSSGHADEKFERKAAGYLLQRRSDALILHLETMSDVELLGWLEQNLPAETPVVIMGRHVTELGNRCIYLDNEKGGFLATQHLLERGHRHIAHITGPLAMKDSRDRLQGYRRALEAAGLPYNEAYVHRGRLYRRGRLARGAAAPGSRARAERYLFCQRPDGGGHLAHAPRQRLGRSQRHFSRRLRRRFYRQIPLPGPDHHSAAPVGHGASRRAHCFGGFGPTRGGGEA